MLSMISSANTAAMSAAFSFLDFFSARCGRFQRERVHQDIGDAGDHFLLLFDRVAELLGRDTQQKQADLLRVGDDIRWTVAV